MDQKWSWEEWKLWNKESKGWTWGGLEGGYKGKQGSETCFSKTVQEMLGAEENDPKQELLEKIGGEMRI